jgi:NADP-dependent 3-hydroxy acid dehydrogenase YdfG
MPVLLNGKVVWITGASQGIGEAVARRLASEGVRLALFARNIEKLKTLVESLHTQYPNCECLVLSGDVRIAEELNTVALHILKHWGKLDILINNAGVASPIGLLQEQSSEEVARIIDTNLKGAIYAMQAAIVPMVAQQSGCILNINSIAGHTAFPFWSVYASSKFGLKAITESVAQEQRQNGIKVCGIYPGAVDTPIWEGVSDSLDAEARKIGMLTVEHVTDAILYILMQPSSVWIPELTIEPLNSVL